MSDSHKPYILAVDGGGSGCRVAIADVDGNTLGIANGDAANVASNIDTTCQNVERAISDALVSAKLDQNDIPNICAHFGLAGYMDETQGSILRNRFSFCKLSLSDDRPTTVLGALAGADGYVIGIGTGTFCAASNAGKMSFVSGRGFYISDQASGAWLGRRALEMVIQCDDNIIQHSPLTHALLTLFGDINAMVKFSVTARPRDYATFAPEIIRAANNGDQHGELLMNEGATYLRSALIALGFQSGEPVVLTGGVGPHYARFLKEPFNTNITQPLGNALDGGLVMARELALQSSEACA
ncbi:N-acetylglucosamine kinase [Amylibacter ulvae]|uniref:N-acetylglucosamine kinase n=1 Tax=Paramylibacter ulvae TaxID=1651968 RepID=A0ABQ3CU61_9RHOB|nr:BadF/BadG/BcrA/BcrD ATPase family protein [Amylibacter ulvae]GHA41644.1 N-acetylglucosamine kinase [Amylibacter ulvae]